MLSHPPCKLHKGPCRVIVNLSMTPKTSMPTTFAACLHLCTARTEATKTQNGGHYPQKLKVSTRQRSTVVKKKTAKTHRKEIYNCNLYMRHKHFGKIMRTLEY